MSEPKETHMAWCKRQALEYIEAGDMDQAFRSFASDVTKDASTNTKGVEIILQFWFASRLAGRETLESTRKWIEGFNG